MNRILVQSTMFSVGVHALLLIPVVSGGRFASDARFDVTRGASCVELELGFSPEARVLVSKDAATGEAEVPLPAQKPAKSGTGHEEPWFNDGGALMRGELSSLRNPPPRYPWEARIHGWQGTVLLQAVVSTSGRANSVRVTDSSGHPVLDAAALGAVRQWQFIPARKGERVVASRVEVPITFKLDHEEKRRSP